MKPIHFFLLGLMVALLIAASPAVKTKYFPVSNKAEVYAWNLDTITDAENDTLTLGEVQTSNWYGLFQVDGRQLSGTQSIIVIGQHSAFPAPDADQWKEFDRDTLNGSLEQVVMDVGRMGAFNYRWIMDGGGTQSAEYEAILDLKKD